MGPGKAIFLFGRFRDRFRSLRALAGMVQGVIYFHPTDEDLPVGTPDKENATSVHCFPITATLEPL